jgi:hypothetical protein
VFAEKLIEKMNVFIGPDNIKNIVQGHFRTDRVPTAHHLCQRMKKSQLRRGKEWLFQTVWQTCSIYIEIGHGFLIIYED